MLYRILHLVSSAVVTLAVGTPLSAQQGACLQAGRLGPSADLYCMALTAPPALGLTATAQATLSFASSPFTVAVNADGHFRYDLQLELDGLPEPSSFGPYDRYVAWVTTPTFYPEVRLGTVANGVTTLGPVDLDKFVLLISAEASGVGEEREGKLVLRGESPSTRMFPIDMMEMLLGQGRGLSGPGEPTTGAPAMDHAHVAADGWLRPPMPDGLTMLPALMELDAPNAAPFLPSVEDPSAVPFARPRELALLSDGDTLDLEATYVRRRLRGADHIMYGFNGQIPGPLIQVTEASTITVEFTNSIDWPTTIHWHGIRIDNASDGVPGITQEPVQPGEHFTYTIHFRDPGIYWYHPHHREDILKDLGLSGNLMVRPERADYYAPVNREEVVMLDDILMQGDAPVPFGQERANDALMGRFGDLLLVNGEPSYTLDVERGEVVRFFLTNVSNTRTFNVSFSGAPLKVVGGDVGLYEREEWSESLVLAPAERVIAHVRFPEERSYAFENRVIGIDHLGGQFIPEVDTLGFVSASAAEVTPDLSGPFSALREHLFVQTDIDQYRTEFDRPVDHELVLDVAADSLPYVVQRLMSFDSAYFHPVEWSGNMPMMNWNSTSAEVQWSLSDPQTGRSNMDIGWEFEVGDVVKIRVHNERRAFHAMQHPLHIHGQRFLVLSVNGIETENLVWKDTVLVPVGGTVDLLLELSNPGDWMMHCHISEHLEAGMRSVFTVR
jgi:suppressor of ftsI